ncbi:hypothetical protein ABPG75_006231 [Micractinium tetrahymenae]
MGTSKTPGRLGLRSMLGLGKGDEGREGSAATAAAAAKADATVDIGALMRKKRLLVGTSGVGAGGGLPSSRGAAAPATSHFAAGLGLDVSVENPVYSPDDSLVKAASKLQSLKALRATAPRPLAASAGNNALAGSSQLCVAAPAPAVQAPAAAAASTAAAPSTASAEAPESQMAAPPPQACDSPPVHDVAKHASQAAEAGQRLSDEDSGELAALSALQRRRRSVAPGSAQKRYGSWFEGGDRELEHTLQEYNQAAPASPRMTRAQRRKSLAVDRSVALEAGLAAAAQGEAAADGGREEQPQQAQQQQQPKRAGGGWRKSMAAPQQAATQPAEPAQTQIGSVAAEVAALNAEMCAQLDGMIEDSPDKKSRGDSQSLRDKLLQSWDGRSYYERLLQMSQDQEQGKQASKEERHGGRQQQQQPQQPAAQQRHPSRAGQAAVASMPAAAAEQPARPSSRTPAPAKPAAAVPSAAPAARPAPLQVAGVGVGSGGSSGAAKAALLTPNSQRRKLNELTTSLQLLKVTSRHRSQPVVAAGAGAHAGEAASTAVTAAPGGQAAHVALTASLAAGRPGTAEQVAAPESAAACSRTPGRSRSASPEAEEPPPAAVPKTGSKRSSRRGTTPPTEASAAPPAAVAGQAAPAAAEQAATAQADAMRGEVAAAYEMLNAALAEKDKIGEQLKRVEAELAAEHAQRQATQEEAERLRQELQQARRERKVGKQGFSWAVGKGKGVLPRMLCLQQSLCWR